jgi:hypothetical protein
MGKGNFISRQEEGSTKKQALLCWFLDGQTETKTKPPNKNSEKFTHKGEDEKIAEVLYPLPDLSLE